MDDSSRTIPPIEHNGNLVFDDIEKAELFNKFFCEQSTLDDSDHTPPDLTDSQFLFGWKRRQ
jgi:hypothetical protein